jgi:hypothetical protein
MSCGRLNPTLVYWLQTWGSESHKKTGLEYPSITQEGKLLHSPGRGGGSVDRSPRYEPNQIATAVERAVERLVEGEGYLLGKRYKDGASDKLIGLFLGVSGGKVRWRMEGCHRNIAKELGMEVYKGRRRG